MTYVVTGNCQDCRFTECVTVCPVACFHLGDAMVYINPGLCIDCGACAPMCPVEAIAMDFDLSGDDERWIKVNEEQSTTAPRITKKQPELPTAAVRRAELGF